jgi:hypothetical protein
VLVIDEVPYLMDVDGAFEGMLQRAWDRVLETKPVLLVLIGSDLSKMEALNSYGRPFHQRGREMVLGPLNPAEVGRMLGLDPAEAFDAALVNRPEFDAHRFICFRPIDRCSVHSSQLHTRPVVSGRVGA